MTLTGIVGIVIVLVVVGVVLWLIDTQIPMSPPFKVVIRVIVVIALCLYLLTAFGLIDGPLLVR